MKLKAQQKALGYHWLPVAVRNGGRRIGMRTSGKMDGERHEPGGKSALRILEVLKRPRWLL